MHYSLIIKLKRTLLLQQVYGYDTVVLWHHWFTGSLVH